MYNDKLISVIVPVYNVRDYIIECLDSIQNQSYSNLQIIIVDDGSNDGSENICDLYAKKDSRFIVIHKKNGGVTSARKVGLKYATGKYIGFVDADDWIESSMYEEMLLHMENSKCDLVHTYKIKQLGKVSYSIQESEENVLLESPKTKTDFIKSVLCASFTAVLWLNLYRTDIIKKCYDFLPNTFNNGDDYVVNTDYILQCKSIYILPKAFYHYRRREGSIQHAHDASLIHTTSKQFEYLQEVLLRNDMDEIFFRYLDKCLIRRMIYIVNQTNISKYIPIYYPDLPDNFKKKRIVICGAGSIGYEFYKYFLEHTEYNIIKWIDLNYDVYNYGIRIFPLESLKKIEYDVILIAVDKERLAVQIKHSLISLGVEQSKIYWKSPKSIIDER